MTQVTSITNCGQIRTMDLPHQFGEIPRSVETSWDSSVRSRMFVDRDNSDVKVVFFNRGFSLGEPEQQVFNKQLSLPPHVLIAEETKALEKVFFPSCSPDEFTLEQANSEKLNGKQVLRLDGTWTEANIHDTTIFIAARNDEVQEIHLICPAAEFQARKDMFENMLRSIEWLD